MSVETQVTIDAPERPDPAAPPKFDPAPHRDFVEKVAGTLRYADDWGFPGMLHGVVVRAQLPSARIVSIDTAAALTVRGVRAVMTAADIPHNGILDEASGLGVDAIV
jgi:CO/xanthine dehydrogenase Mo-binding subunit